MAGGIRWALVDQGMVSGSNFLIGILLARHLGLQAYGLYSLGWLIVLFLASFQVAGIISPMMTLGPVMEAEMRPRYFGAVLLHQLVFTVVGAALLAGLAVVGPLLPGGANLAGLAWPLAAAGAAYFVQDYVRRVFFTTERFQMAFLIDAVNYLGQVVLFVAWAYLGRLTPASALWIAAGTAGCSAAIGLGRLRWVVLDLTEFREVGRRHWQSSKWLLATAVFQWASTNYLILAASMVLGTWAAGALKACQNIMGLNHILFLALENVMPARAALALREGGRAALYRYLGRMTVLGGGLTGGLAVVAIVAPEALLRAFYGPDFAGQGLVLQGYALVYLLIFMNLPLRLALRTLEQTRPIFVAYAVTSIGCAAIALPLVNRFGLMGVIVGMIGIQAATLLMYVMSLRLARSPQMERAG